MGQSCARHHLSMSSQLGDTRFAEMEMAASGEGFKTLARWRDRVDVLFLRVDRQPPMVAMPWATWVKVVGLLGRD